MTATMALNIHQKIKRKICPNGVYAKVDLGAGLARDVVKKVEYYTLFY